MADKIKTFEELMNTNHEEYLYLIAELGGVVNFDETSENNLEKPIKFRATPHSPSIIIKKLTLKDDFRYDRNLLSCILQRLRKMR